VGKFTELGLLSIRKSKQSSTKKEITIKARAIKGCQLFALVLAIKAIIKHMAPIPIARTKILRCFFSFLSSSFIFPLFLFLIFQFLVSKFSLNFLQRKKPVKSATIPANEFNKIRKTTKGVIVNLIEESIANQ